MIPASPGDVLAVINKGGGLFGPVIQEFEEWQGKSDIANHVVVLLRQDALGRWLGVEGKPSGVGIVDATSYLSDPHTRSNNAQPRLNNANQLPTFLASAVKSVGIAYDWVGIAEDLFNTLALHDLSADIDHLWRWPVAAGLPGHVVCSSLASLLYEIVGWKSPFGVARVVEPADWWSWSNAEAWK
jgi:hypothetical protein